MPRFFSVNSLRQMGSTALFIRMDLLSQFDKRYPSCEKRIQKNTTPMKTCTTNGMDLIQTVAKKSS